MTDFPFQEWLQIAYLLGAVQGTFLATILASRRRNSLPNRLLAVAMFAFSIDLAMAVYHESGADVHFPYLIGLDFPLAFLYGPVIYLYSRAMTRPEQAPGRRALLHFLPFVLLVIFMIPFYLLPPDVKIGILDGTVRSATTDVFYVINPLKLLHGFAYIGMMLAVLRRHRGSLRDELSYAERVNLAWLRNLVIGFVVLAVITALLFGLALGHETPVLGMDPDGWYDDLTLLSVAIFVYAIGYLGLRQPEIFHPGPLGGDVAPREETSSVPRYARSGVDEATARGYLGALLKLMAEKKPYRQGDLTLQDLAGALQFTPHNLTEVLNTQVGKSFYDFVNAYRVREVQERLESPEYQHWSILAIGLEAGFNSKSAFYAVFKKQTGLTPSEYRNRSAKSGAQSPVVPGE